PEEPMIDGLHEQLGALFEVASVGMVVLDRAGQIELANPALAAMFGYEPGELHGQSVELLVIEDMRASHAAGRDGFMATLRMRPTGLGMEAWGRHNDGQAFPIEANLSYLSLGGQTLPIVFVADVTLRKQVEVERDRLLAQEWQARAMAEAAQQRQAFL